MWNFSLIMVWSLISKFENGTSIYFLIRREREIAVTRNYFSMQYLTITCFRQNLHVYVWKSCSE